MAFRRGTLCTRPRKTLQTIPQQACGCRDSRKPNSQESPKLHQVDSSKSQMLRANRGGAKLMRPKKRVADDLTTTYLKKDDSQSEMHIMHRDKTTQMYNECIAEHASLIDSQLCAVPRFTVHTEVKVGLCWKQNLSVLSVDTHQKCSSYTMKYQLRRQGRDLLLQMSAFRWDCRNLPQESLKGE